jgi:hypothetical protein
MCGGKKNNNLDVVLDIRTNVLRLVIDPIRGTVWLSAPGNRLDAPSVVYTINGRCCA